MPTTSTRERETYLPCLTRRGPVWRCAPWSIQTSEPVRGSQHSCQDMQGTKSSNINGSFICFQIAPSFYTSYFWFYSFQYFKKSAYKINTNCKQEWQKIMSFTSNHDFVASLAFLSWLANKRTRWITRILSLVKSVTTKGKKCNRMKRVSKIGTRPKRMAKQAHARQVRPSLHMWRMEVRKEGNLI